MSGSRYLKFSTQQIRNAVSVSVPKIKLNFVILQVNKETE